MARPAFATEEDLSVLLGTDIDDILQAQARLAQASELVRAYAGTDWLNDDETEVEDVPGAIPGVVLDIVERATRNPGGVTSESTGPFSRSFGADAAARMYLTAGNKLVIRHATGAASGLGIISTTRGTFETPAVLDDWGGLSGLPEADTPYSLWP